MIVQVNTNLINILHYKHISKLFKIKLQSCNKVIIVNGAVTHTNVIVYLIYNEMSMCFYANEESFTWNRLNDHGTFFVDGAIAWFAKTTNRNPFSACRCSVQHHSIALIDFLSVKKRSSTSSYRSHCPLYPHSANQNQEFHQLNSQS